MKFEGIYTALITPFQNSGKGIDEAAYKKLIERQIEAGVSGVIVAGSTGEGQTITDSEFRDLLQIALTYKGKIQILGSCGTSSTDETAARFKNLAEMKVDAALIAAPAYNKPPQRGLIEHYRRVAAAAPALPIMVYNIPGRTAVNIAPATMKEIWKIPNVFSLKESSGNWEQILEIKKDLPAGKFLLSGDDPLNLPFFSAGAFGSVSVLSNVVPKALVKMCEAARAGNFAQAEQIQMQVLPLTKLLFVESNPIPVKWAVSKILGKSLEPRLPLVTLDAAHHSAIESELKIMGNLGYLP